MSRRETRSVAWVASVLLSVACAASAGELRHVVRPGESASSIAKHYYDDYELADLLLSFNDRRGSVIRAGETLRVPYCEVHRVRAGDVWSVLSQRYLGRPDRYATVASLNGLPSEAPLRVGQRIVFPVSLPHRLERGETLAILAERFYGDPTLGRMLQQFNRIEDPRRLAVGASLEIPVVALTLERRQPPPPADRTVERRERPQASPEPRSRPAEPVVVHASAAQTGSAASGATPVETPPTPAPRPRFALPLGEASTALGRGEYERARELLESLRPRVVAAGAATERIELWRLLAVVYVAFDLDDEACGAYRALREIDPDPELDPDAVSPKIRKTLSACAGS